MVSASCLAAVLALVWLQVGVMAWRREVASAWEVAALLLRLLEAAAALPSRVPWGCHTG